MHICFISDNKVEINHRHVKNCHEFIVIGNRYINKNEAFTFK